MGPLTSEITFTKKQIISRSKTAVVLAELNFETILLNTEYVLRCVKTVMY